MISGLIDTVIKPLQYTCFFNDIIKSARELPADRKHIVNISVVLSKPNYILENTKYVVGFRFIPVTGKERLRRVQFS